MSLKALSMLSPTAAAGSMRGSRPRTSLQIAPAALPGGGSNVRGRGISSREGSGRLFVRASSSSSSVSAAAVTTEASPPSGSAADRSKSHETDVVVIGAGIGGLCAGALLARYGKRVTVVESHVIAGGAAHAWHRDGYTFESGPSLYSGMSTRPSNNPIGQVLDALGEELPCAYYNTWMMHLPEGDMITEVGNDQFLDVLSKYVDDEAAQEWRDLKELMKPLAGAATIIPSAAIRTDPAVLITLARYLPKLANPEVLKSLPDLMKPFSEIIDGKVTHPFILQWMDLLCFLLSGQPAKGTLAAEIGYMFEDWYRPGSTLEFPYGGSGAIVSKLVKGLEKHGGRLMLSSHVEEVMVKGERAAGVRLRGGAEIRATEAVVSNADVWNTVRMLPDGAVPKEWADEKLATGECESFMHLHLGIDAHGLPDDLEIHHIYIEDWERGVTGPQNLVLVSIASVLDPSMAPEGKHVVHAYTPGTEPYSLWEGLDRNSEEYRKLKEERSQILWRAVEKAIPDVRSRVEIEMVGTPLTCERFLRRNRGTYGGAGWVGEGDQAVPSAETPLPGLYLVGDTNFPGPGVPAVAAGGTQLASSMVPVWKQLELLKAIGA